MNSTDGFWFTFAYNSVNNTPVATPGAANDRSHVSGVNYLVDGTATGTGAVRRQQLLGPRNGNLGR